jgi:hypothetical protein
MSKVPPGTSPGQPVHGPVSASLPGSPPANTLTAIFRDHACWACKDGALPCRSGHPHRCDNPHARND